MPDPTPSAVQRSSLPEARCPTCRAAWRGAAVCARCGTDLGPLMRLAARAWQLREQARQALRDGDRAAQALAAARAACQLQATPRGLRLLALALLANGHTAQAVSLIERLLDEDDSRLPKPPASLNDRDG